MVNRLKYQRVRYSDLTSRQKENYNFQKVSSVLADYGFSTIRLSDDWQGADFIAQHRDGNTFIKVQLKSRLSFFKKYQGKDLYICFPHGVGWFLFPHDEILAEAQKLHDFGETQSWMDSHGYSFPNLPKKLNSLLDPYYLLAESTVSPAS